MKITEQKLREAIRNSINKLNEAKSYDLDLENAREYEGVIGDAIKKLEGIDAYHKMAEDGGGTAVNSTASMIYISQYGKTDNTDALKKILKKADSNLDVNNIKNNFDATDRERSGHEQDNDIWKYNIPKKIDYHKAKKMGILPEPNVTQMDHEVVGELLNMLAAYTSEGNPLANIAWTSLDSFMAAAHDYVRGSDWKKFKKDVETKYPVLEKRWNSDMMELSKIETWVRKSDMNYDDWEWDGKELTIFLKKGNPEKYSKEDLEEEGVFESKLTEAEDYKYKKNVAKAFEKINDAMFNFRHAMGVKQLTNKDDKLKNKFESIHQAIFDLQREMRSDGLTESKLNEKSDLKKLVDKLGSRVYPPTNTKDFGEYTEQDFDKQWKSRSELRRMAEQAYKARKNSKKKEEILLKIGLSFDAYRTEEDMKNAGKAFYERWMEYENVNENLESKLNENAILTFSNELNDEGIVAGIFDGVGDGKTVKAQFTKKKWDDGVPVTKFFTRGGYKDIKTPKGKFQLIETPHFWYYEINKGWAAVNKEDYGTPPFEY